MHRDHDAELLRDCKKGDRQALGSLVRRYERPVYNAAFRMMGNPDEAADVTQTVFLKAFENLDRYQPKFKFFSWIYRIAINECIDQLNRRNRFEPLDENPEATARGPVDVAVTGQLGRDIQAVLMALNEDHRSVIVLRHFTELSYREMSEILQIPEKTVKSRLFSARQQMKGRLEEMGILSA
ncbi:MAG: sigma-70 family RNA polymerase sigma factor [Xanthomonadales bacterium]|nr:sigma-70 family RNA polymerase sigma factor [Xanthomonadales bacterium]NIN58970.1 sigma-70 family RNA polymerase sigma factor [Xanthomonadales bacterium]NIN74235.1 sigma-70 family RNA polymerase sigma factor [Xanthomonadales bacterium]NIO13908.1 sigma-70 family RNA polymerase sigma factor [Xanthomonadales bacterium]NIP11363.1 sigma-70 family RNA polymerase sigma factor [Xanthomonadales bacterium]